MAFNDALRAVDRGEGHDAVAEKYAGEIHGTAQTGKGKGEDVEIVEGEGGLRMKFEKMKLTRDGEVWLEVEDEESGEESDDGEGDEDEDEDGDEEWQEDDVEYYEESEEYYDDDYEDYGELDSVGYKVKIKHQNNPCSILSSNIKNKKIYIKRNYL